MINILTKEEFTSLPFNRKEEEVKKLREYFEDKSKKDFFELMEVDKYFYTIVLPNAF